MRYNFFRKAANEDDLPDIKTTDEVLDERMKEYDEKLGIDREQSEEKHPFFAPSPVKKSLLGRAKWYVAAAAVGAVCGYVSHDSIDNAVSYAKQVPAAFSGIFESRAETAANVEPSVGQAEVPVKTEAPKQYSVTEMPNSTRRDLAISLYTSLPSEEQKRVIENILKQE